ncbi:MAG: hypothetical protein A2Z84_07755 [Tenericutes bacterium GWA2_35_7]|nr:MAG: hypothetical protein A2Z84_07755 [Tenericutes bacterium GWA2_35_7]
MKKMITLFTLLITVLILISCTATKNADIVTTMFPQYDFATQIVKNKLTVSLLLPPGVEAHAYESTSKDLVTIEESKLFIFTSLDIDTWIKDPKSLGGDQTVIMNLSEHYILEEHEHDDLGAIENIGEHEDEDELHFWVDPVIAMQLLDAILEEIVQIDPENETFYRTNAEIYYEELQDLHESFDTFMQSGYIDVDIFFAGHNALGLFGKRYHLHIASLFESFKPDADLTSSELISFTEIIKQAGVHILFIEELAEPKAADQITNELAKEQYDLEIFELHAYHNLTKKDLEDGVRYADLLERNIEFIKQALNNNND